MKQFFAAVAAAVTGSLLCACGGSPPAGTPGTAGPRPAASAAATPAAVAASTATAPPCRPAAIAFGYGGPVSPMTGEWANLYTLTNRGPASCMLTGYPKVAILTAGGAPLAFHYRHGGEYVTSMPPRDVVLPPGAAAYVLVAKYRCDLGVQTVAPTIQLTLPAPQRTVFTRPADTGRVRGFPYCRGGPHDPGQVVSVSPIEATVSATSSVAGSQSG